MFKLFSISVKLYKLFYSIGFLCLLFPVFISAQTTGKISGKVTDAQTGEPLIGANIILEGTTYGAASDVTGEFFIINIPPGKYRLKASLVGYESIIMENLVVSVNRTTNADFKLNETVIQGQEVVITVPRIQTKKDQTSSIRNVTADEIKLLPVESLDAIVSLQAGVVQGHFRGGRRDEVAYMVDGVKVDEAFRNTRTVTVENNTISEVEIITGTFNAEYGNAMSGVVNTITKDGSPNFGASLTVSSSNYLTPHNEVFFGIDDTEILRNKDVSLFVEGPVIGSLLTFVANGRYQDNTGPRSGIRLFRPDDYSNFSGQNAEAWISERTGNEAIVPMEQLEIATLFGKLSFKPSGSIRTYLNYSYNQSTSQFYSHFFKYNPDGRTKYYNWSHLGSLTLNHTITQALFYEFKSSFLYSKDANYLYENPLDLRYVHDEYLNGAIGPGFSTGGQNKTWNENWSINLNQKLDVTFQATKNHVFKAGFDLTNFTINQFNTEILNAFAGTGLENNYTEDPVTGFRTYYNYLADTSLINSTFNDIYEVKPWQYSVYIQDKMEFNEMVINLGLRFDYFNPNSTYPSEPRNPDNKIQSRAQSVYLKAPSSSQLSPRFGISYKLGEQALLRFSYGHFFQTPPLYALYTNFHHVIGTGDFQTLMGNPKVKAQKTIQYEAGLWLQLSTNMSAEVAVFYRDIYDLLGTSTLETFNAIKYGLYTNKDYGNGRGLELKYDYISGNFSARVNYTLQYTRGNADNPTFSFSREGAELDPVNVLIPMSWDQRHTLNTSISYSTERFGGSIVGRLDSGTPYTYSPLARSRLANVHLNPHNSSMPLQFSVDLQAFVNLFKIGSTSARLNLIVYNLLDRLNEVSVDPTTGRANQVIIEPSDLEGYRSNFSTLQDVNNNPGSYSDPRLIKLGLEVTF